MGQRLIYQLDLLDLKRRRRYEGAARRNGKKLSVWLREVADAAAERRPVPVVAEPVHGVWGHEWVKEPDPEPEPASHEHVLRRTPWGGRVCEGCGDLL